MKRSELSVAKKVCMMYVDIDVCENKLPTKMAWEKIANDCIEGKFPPPSLVVASGQGFQLVWQIADVPNAMPSWRRVEKCLFDALNSAAPKALNTTCILRMPFTVNRESERREIL